MSETLTFDRFVRTPFVIEVVKITEENIDAIAKICGEVREENGKKYIAIDRRVVRDIGRAHVGWFFTRLKDNYRCYSPKVFEEQFVQLAEDGKITFDLSII